jgi:hypothetical protein
MKVDFSNVGDFEVIPAGHYLVTITDGELRTAGETAKHPGSEMILWTLTIMQGQYEGRKLFVNTTLLPHALFSLKNLLKSTGRWEEGDLSGDEFEFEIDDALGAEVIAVVRIGTYQGEETNNVRRFRPVTEEALSQLGADRAGSDLLP